jgi:DHA1 family multidrug resistance protein-like MFS transporter
MSWKKSFYAILAAEVLALMGFSTSIPILPLYFQKDMGITDPVALKLWIGGCATISPIMLFIFAPIWGQLADTVGKRAMLLRAMFGGTVVLGLMGIANHPWQVLVLRGMQGALTGTISAATVLVANITPRERIGVSLGLLQTGIYAGSSLGPALGGALSDLVGCRVNFFVTSGLLLCAAVIVLVFVQADPPRAGARGSILKRIVPDFSPVRQTQGLLILLLVACALQAAMNTISPMLTLFIQSLESGGGLIGSRAGLVMGLTALSAALAAAGLGRASHRIGFEKTLRIGLSAAAFVLLLQAFVRNWIQLLVLRMIGGALIGGSEPSLNSLIALRVDKNRQGAIFGLTSSMNNLGALTGPSIGAFASSVFGYPSMFVAAAAILTASAAAAWRLRKAAPPPARGAPA